jgi:hypothetical protein
MSRNVPSLLELVWHLQFIGNAKPPDNKVINLDTTNSSATNRKATDCQSANGQRTECDCANGQRAYGRRACCLCANALRPKREMTHVTRRL